MTARHKRNPNAPLRTSSGAWLRGVLDMFAAEGLDVPALLRDCGFDATGLDRPDARFPADDISQLWLLAVARSGKATLGLSRELARATATSTCSATR